MTHGMLASLFRTRHCAVPCAGLWIPVLTLVPLIHLIFGLFPITFNLWVVVFMMIHYAVRTVMLHWSDSFKQMRALWLARVAASLYWWSDLKAAVLVPAKAIIGNGVSFRSRSWSTAVPVRNLKALIIPFATVVVSITAFAGGCVTVRTTINLPTVLSLCLVAINAVPPALLCLYWTFGPGRLLSKACTLGMWTSWAAGVAGIVFLWLLWPRNVNFERAADMSLSFYDAQRSGALPSNYPVTWRGDSGLMNVAQMTFTVQSKQNAVLAKGVTNTIDVDLTGGFYNDGEVGPVKITWNIALTTTMLAWSLLEYEDFWGQQEVRKNHAIALLTHGLAYVSATYQIVPLTDETGKPLSSANDQVVYVVRTPLLATCSACSGALGSMHYVLSICKRSQLFVCGIVLHIRK